MDTTAVKKIKKLLRYTDESGLIMIITNLTTKMREDFEASGVHELRVSHDGHGHGHGHGSCALPTHTTPRAPSSVFSNSQSLQSSSVHAAL